jgi:hypothetical protein
VVGGFFMKLLADRLAQEQRWSARGRASYSLVTAASRSKVL